MKNAIPVGSPSARPRASPAAARWRHGRPGDARSRASARSSSPRAAPTTCARAPRPTSSNGDVVTTAGHCVNEGPGAFVTNFAFVPAYNNGAGPYGTWTAEGSVHHHPVAEQRRLRLRRGLRGDERERLGQSLTRLVGSYPIAFNLAARPDLQGLRLPGRQALQRPDALVVHRHGRRRTPSAAAQDQGLACNMTGGSSGGGWITGGSLNSVTSFGYTGVKNILFGPYFGNDHPGGLRRPPRSAERSAAALLADHFTGHSSARRA